MLRDFWFNATPIQLPVSMVARNLLQDCQSVYIQGKLTKCFEAFGSGLVNLNQLSVIMVAPSHCGKNKKVVVLHSFQVIKPWLYGFLQATLQKHSWCWYGGVRTGNQRLAYTGCLR